MSAQNLYEKALRSYMLTKYTPAANNCLKAIAALPSSTADNSPLRLSIWTLYLNIVSTLLINTPFLGLNIKLLGIDSAGSVEEACRSVWKKVTEQGFGGVENTDSKIVSACLNMDLQLDQYSAAREAAEAWFASLSDAALDGIAADDQSPASLGYSEVADLYIGRILPGMDDFDSARTFLEYNSVLKDSKKKALESSIKDQQQSKIEKQRLEQEAKRALEEKQKEQERQLVEEARRLEEEKRQAKEEEEEQEERQAEEKEQARQRQQQEEKKDEQQRGEADLQRGRLPPSSVETVSRAAPVKRNLTVIQKWKKQLTTRGAAASGAILILIFALMALLRGQRGRLSVALQGVMAKLWQTVKMGTKVTYM